jgi:ankyrin repeat protein
MLFVEEFPTVLQDDINAYLDPGAKEMSQPLAKHILNFKNQYAVDLALLLDKAKAANAKVFSINSGDSAVVNVNDPRHHEYRCAVMNETAEKVMKKAIEENPNVKFLAVCGTAHSNTFPGGIPGLAQILNVPAVEMSPTGKLYVKAEDPANRRRPSKEERAFVDQYMKQVLDEYKKATETIQEAEGIDTVELRKEALALADRFKRGGRLNGAGDVAGLLTDKAAKDKQNDLILRTARRHASKAECKSLIERGLDDELDDLLNTVQVNDPHGYHRLVTGHEQKETLLHDAAKAGQAGCLERLAARGFDLEATNKEGRTAFMLAAAEGKGAAVKKLSDLGADVNAATFTDGKTALHLAAEAGTVPHRLLAAPNLNLNPVDASGSTPMHSAAAAGKTGSIGRLQAKGVSLDGADPQGQTALHKAIAAGQFATALDLVQKGVNVKALAGGKSPLHLAAEKGDLALFKALLSAGADKNQVDADGRTPLHIALLAGKTDLANRLMLNGARIDVADADGNTPLHLALEKKQDGTVQGLLFRGADPQVRNKQGLSALDVAAQAGGKNYVIAKHVVDKGFSADTRTDLAYLGEFLTAAQDEYTAREKPEGAAVALDEREAAQLALERVGRLRQRGDLANDTKPEAIARMAKSGANRKDATDMYARAEGRQRRLDDVKDLAMQENAAEFDANLIEITRMLDEDPALIHVAPTLLHDASKVGNERLVTLLLARGANVMYRNEGGETPLHKSCQRCAYTSDDARNKPASIARATRSANIATALLAAAPDAKAKEGLLNAQTNLGRTALHLAAYADHPKVIEDLCQAGAREISATSAVGGRSRWRWHRPRAAPRGRWSSTGRTRRHRSSIPIRPRRFPRSTSSAWRRSARTPRTRPRCARLTLSFMPPRRSGPSWILPPWTPCARACCRKKRTAGMRTTPTSAAPASSWPIRGRSAICTTHRRWGRRGLTTRKPMLSSSPAIPRTTATTSPATSSMR